MAATTTTLANVLKTEYAPLIYDQLNEESLIFRMFDEGTENWNGDSFRISLRTATVADSAVEWGDEGASIPAASQQTYQALVVQYAALRGSFEVTGEAEAVSEAGGSVDAYRGAMFTEMERLKDTLVSRVNRKMFDGRGCHAFLVDNLATGVINGRMVSGANHLVSGGYYRILHVPRADASSWQYLGAGGLGAGNDVFQVTNIDLSAGTCTLADVTGAAGPGANIAGTDTDLYVLIRVTGFADNTRLGLREIHGINCLAFGPDSADMYGNQRDGVNNTVLRGFGFKAAFGSTAAGMSSGADLTLRDMQGVVDSLRDRSIADVDTIIGHTLTVGQYRDLFQYSVLGATPTNAINWIPGESNAKGGFGIDAVMFNQTIPVVISKDAPYGVFYFINRSTLKTYTLLEGQFNDFGGGNLFTQKRNGAGVLMDRKEGFYKQYFDFACNTPRSIGVMAGVRYKRLA